MGIYGDYHYWYCIGIFKFLIPIKHNLDLERKYISKVIYLYNVQFFFSVSLQFNSSLNIAYTVKNKTKMCICRWDHVSFQTISLWDTAWRYGSSTEPKIFLLKNMPFSFFLRKFVMLIRIKTMYVVITNAEEN